MVTSSFVNSLNIVQEMAKPSKNVRQHGDDKFKDLMNKDESSKSVDDKKVAKDAKGDNNKVEDKNDKSDLNEVEQNPVKDEATDEKVLSSEIAKMLVNINAIPNTTAKEVAVTDSVIVGSELADTNLDVKGAIQLGAPAEEALNAQNVVVDATNENLKNANSVVNGKIASTENGKIQLNEAFKPVDQNGDDSALGELLKEGMNQNGAEEKVAESLGANFVQNDSKVDIARPTMVQNSEFVAEPEAMLKPEETIDKMAKAFMKEFTQGRHEMEIALEPANLGKLTIKVAYEAGKAVVSILCSERNLDLISKNSAQIAGILQQYTGDETKIVVEQPQPDYLNQKDNQNDQQQREQKYKKENDKTSDDKETADFLEQLRLGLVKEV